MLTAIDHMAGTSARERKRGSSKNNKIIRYRSNAAGEPETETKIQSQKCKQREQGKADRQRDRESDERPREERAIINVVVLVAASSVNSCIFMLNFWNLAPRSEAPTQGAVVVVAL